jgi:hypothetical protein
MRTWCCACMREALRQVFGRQTLPYPASQHDISHHVTHLCMGSQRQQPRLAPGRVRAVRQRPGVHNTPDPVQQAPPDPGREGRARRTWTAKRCAAAWPR